MPLARPQSPALHQGLEGDGINGQVAVTRVICDVDTSLAAALLSSGELQPEQHLGHEWCLHADNSALIYVWYQSKHFVDSSRASQACGSGLFQIQQATSHRSQGFRHHGLGCTRALEMSGMLVQVRHLLIWRGACTQHCTSLPVFEIASISRLMLKHAMITSMLTDTGSFDCISLHTKQSAVKKAEDLQIHWMIHNGSSSVALRITFMCPQVLLEIATGECPRRGCCPTPRCVPEEPHPS